VTIGGAGGGATGVMICASETWPLDPKAMRAATKRENRAKRFLATIERKSRFKSGQGLSPSTR
jgi:hypothetical protein